MRDVSRRQLGRSWRSLYFALMVSLAAVLLTVATPAAPAAAAGSDAGNGTAASVTDGPRIARLSATRAARTQQVTVTGTGFGEQRGDAVVTFGGRRATAYIRWSDERIICRVPAKAKLGRIRVRVQTGLGLSNARWLRVRLADRLGTPQPVRPEGTVESARPLFRWRAAANATSYEVRVVLNGVTIYSQARIMGRSLRLPRALPAGAPVSWKVRARRAGRAGPWSQAAEFRVRRRPTNGGDTTYTELALFAGNFVPQGFRTADGSVQQFYDPLARRQDTDLVILYVLLHTAYGGDGRTTFGLPLAKDCPPGARPDDYGNNGRWLVAATGIFPLGIPDDAFPGQVAFSASAGLPWNGSFRQKLADQGAVVNPAGAEVFTGCAAYDVPADHESPDAGCLVGELRLFKQTTDLPDGFIPADGRVLEVWDTHAHTVLYSVITAAYGWVSSTQFRVPAVTAPDGYVWAIAAEGDYPVRQ